MIIKAQYLSKTNWLAAISLVLFVFATPEFNHLIPLAWLPYIGLGVAILTYILRTFFTSQPVTEFAAKQTPTIG